MLGLFFSLLACAIGDYTRVPEDQLIINMNGYNGVLLHWIGPEFSQLGRDWGGLCATGQYQTPIDINTKSPDPSEYQVVTATNSSLTPFVFQNSVVDPVIQFMGTYDVYFTFSGTISQDFNSITIEQEQCGFLFQVPAEHTIDGVIYPLGMEFGYVVPSPTGLVEIGYQVYVLVKEGKRNIAIDQVINQEPADMVHFFPPGGVMDDYFFYMGSIDAEPCSEGFPWIVSNYIIEASIDQIAYFQDLYINDLSYSGGLGNVRVIQPLNGRTVYHFIPTPEESASSFLS